MLRRGRMRSRHPAHTRGKREGRRARGKREKQNNEYQLLLCVRHSYLCQY